MNTSELLYARLQNHFLADVLRLREPQEVVARMGAMQAQALEQAKWAIGVRLGGQTLNDVD
ncbi:MAG: winged helix DNA-binding domain-containing protein, partial [Tannerella sp.]|nr:winged helix DNA-binding domain-containing protein [Tannerella sp.]